MSIRISIKEFCERRGVLFNGNEITSSYRLKLAANLNSPTTANQLWQSEMRKIGLETIEDLCRSLGCTPNDLFEFDPPLAQSTPVVKYMRDATAPPIKKKRAVKPILKPAAKKERHPRGVSDDPRHPAAQACGAT